MKAGATRMKMHVKLQTTSTPKQLDRYQPNINDEFSFGGTLSNFRRLNALLQMSLTEKVFHLQSSPCSSEPTLISLSRILAFTYCYYTQVID